MKIGMDSMVTGLIALGAFSLIIYVVYVILKREDDVGLIVTKKIGNQSMFLLEILLIVMNLAEMLTAVSIQATNTEFEIDFGGRLALHAALALTSIIGGFRFSKDLKEAFTSPTFVQWLQVIVDFILVIGGPVVNLLIMAYAMNQFNELAGYTQIDQLVTYSDGSQGYELVTIYQGFMTNIRMNILDPTLFAAALVTFFHCFLVIVIAVVSYDKVYNIDGTKKDDKKKKKDSKKDKEEFDPKAKAKQVGWEEAAKVMAKVVGTTFHDITKKITDRPKPEASSVKAEMQKWASYYLNNEKAIEYYSSKQDQQQAATWQSKQAAMEKNLNKLYERINK
jgi:hypothetical protein